MFLRPEYLPEAFRHPLDERHLVASVRRQGVLLAVLYDRQPRKNANPGDN
jgi:hypothetical protein